MKDKYDIIVIGGGITGAGIFEEAVHRGYKTLLLEKNDFASGTSSKSSKLVHGGLRYLEQFRFSLVKESLIERGKLVQQFPHIVKFAPFMFPIYKQKWKLKIGMLIYQWLSRKQDVPKHIFLSKMEVIKEYPGINPDRLKGGFIYYDAITNDARLVNEVILNAVEQGGEAKNYTEVTQIKKGDMFHTIHTKELFSNKENTFCAKYVINSTGAWSERFSQALLHQSYTFAEPTKGVHVFFKKNLISIPTTVYIPSFQGDNRFLFIIPWEDQIMFGTTDTNFDGNIDSIDIDKEDINYLLKTINTFYPNKNINSKDIIGCFAGLRPLFKGEGKPSKKSREYKIWWNTERVLSIYGGKLTSFQSMARKCLNYLPKKETEKIEIVLTSNRFTEKYGPFSKYIYEIYSTNESSKKIIFNDTTLAEVLFFIRFTSVKTIEDLLTRRFSISYKHKSIKNYEEVVIEISYILKEELLWSEEERKNNITTYFKGLSEMWNWQN